MSLFAAIRSPPKKLNVLNRPIAEIESAGHLIVIKPSIRVGGGPHSSRSRTQYALR